MGSELSLESAKITQFILPWVGILLSLMIAIWVKDFATALAKGLKFKMNKSFNEGDKVILDGSNAIIVKIGREAIIRDSRMPTQGRMNCGMFADSNESSLPIIYFSFLQVQ